MRIGEVRSLIPSSVCVMALTARATIALQHDIQQILGMKSPAVVALSPSKANIMFVVKSHDTVTEAFQLMLEQLQEQRVLFLALLYIVEGLVTVVCFTLCLRHPWVKDLLNLLMHLIFQSTD